MYRRMHQPRHRQVALLFPKATLNTAEVLPPAIMQRLVLDTVNLTHKTCQHLAAGEVTSMLLAPASSGFSDVCAWLTDMQWKGCARDLQAISAPETALPNLRLAQDHLR